MLVKSYRLNSACVYVQFNEKEAISLKDSKGVGD